MHLIIPKRKKATRTKGPRKVFRMFKRLDDGSLLIAGWVTKTPTYYTPPHLTLQHPRESRP